MASADMEPGRRFDGSNAALWKLIRTRAHQLATLHRHPTDRELDEFTRLVEQLPPPAALRPSR